MRGDSGAGRIRGPYGVACKAGCDNADRCEGEVNAGLITRRLSVDQELSADCDYRHGKFPPDPAVFSASFSILSPTAFRLCDAGTAAPPLPSNSATPVYAILM